MGFVLNIDGERIKDIKKGLASAAKRAGVDGVTPHVFQAYRCLVANAERNEDQ